MASPRREESLWKSDSAPGGWQPRWKSQIVECKSSHLRHLRKIFGVCGLILENNGLRFQIRTHRLATTFASDPGLFEAPEGDPEVGAEAIMAYSTGPHLSCKIKCAVGVISEHGCVEAVDRVVSYLDGV